MPEPTPVNAIDQSEIVVLVDESVLEAPAPVM